jgi:hypothetical protein
VGIKIFRTETGNPEFYTIKNFPPALGGWLIILIIVLIGSPLQIIKSAVDNNYYSVSKWDNFTVGISSVINRALLVFEIIGKTAIVCLSVFCLVLIFKKRDITPHFLKIYYFSYVAFLFIDYLLNAFLKGNFSTDDVGGIIEQIVVAAIWTYYVNNSIRVRQTFIVPYPN